MLDRDEFAKTIFPLAKKVGYVGENTKEQNSTAQPKRGYGRMNLKMISIDLKTDTKTLIKILKDNNMEAKPEETLKEIADRYNKTPFEVFEIIEKGLKR